ncbi:unnamed protein product [Ilex paraguariensis]|uniref:Uncharacterized protein n=1 Tax=Ilex paraguariensis TaxID=185542 RepID=A0ABC8TL63_9AQUA
MNCLPILDFPDSCMNDYLLSQPSKSLNRFPVGGFSAYQLCRTWKPSQRFRFFIVLELHYVPPFNNFANFYQLLLKRLFKLRRVYEFGGPCGTSKLTHLEHLGLPDMKNKMPTSRTESVLTASLQFAGGNRKWGNTCAFGKLARNISLGISTYGVYGNGLFHGVDKGMARLREPATLGISKLQAAKSGVVATAQTTRVEEHRMGTSISKTIQALESPKQHKLDETIKLAVFYRSYGFPMFYLKSVYNGNQQSESLNNLKSQKASRLSN